MNEWKKEKTGVGRRKREEEAGKKVKKEEKLARDRNRGKNRGKMMFGRSHRKKSCKKSARSWESNGKKEKKKMFSTSSQTLGMMSVLFTHFLGGEERQNTVRTTGSLCWIFSQQVVFLLLLLLMLELWPLTLCDLCMCEFWREEERRAKIIAKDSVCTFLESKRQEKKRSRRDQLSSCEWFRKWRLLSTHVAPEFFSLSRVSSSEIQRRIRDGLLFWGWILFLWIQ